MAEQSLATPEIAMESSRLARYSRQLALPGFDESTQLKLANSRVLVIGAGGLGSAAVPYLASTGVGTIGILDTDTVELSNLHRQVVHGMGDLGRSKLDSIADSVARIDPEIQVVKHNLRVDSSNVLELLSQYDLLVDGSDNFPTRYLASDAAAISGKPLVWGAILQYGGQVGVSWSDRGPTYRDLFPVPPAPGDIPNCAEGGVLPGVCAVIGAIMSTEVVKILSGAGEPLVGRVCTYDALTGRFREIPFRANPAAEPVTELIDYEAFCGIEKETAIVEELNPAALKELLDRGTELQLVDIREPFEREIVHLDDSDFIPMGQLPSRLSELRNDVPVVLYCHHGTRSARALSFLRERGMANATHLAGGIDAFAREIAPELQRY